MKFLISKAFIGHIERMTDIERSEILYELIYHAQGTNISHPDRYMRGVIEEFITPFFEKKKQVSQIRSEIGKRGAISRYNQGVETVIKKSTPKQKQEWTPEEIELGFNEPEEIQIRYGLGKYRTPIADIPEEIPEETCDEEEPQRKFPERPEEYCPFPEPDITTPQKTPKDFSPTTQNFWNIFLTLDKKSLNELPFSWHEIAGDIQERMTQIDRITTPVVLNIKEAKISKEPTE